MQVHLGRTSPENLLIKENSTIKLFLSGCNFKCPFCNTPDLIEQKTEQLIDLKNIKREIKDNIGSIKEIIFTGGEPTFQRQALVNLASFCKDANLKVTIETNASKPFCLKQLLDMNLIDAIIVDLKAPFTEEEFKKITKCETFFINSAAIIKNIKQSVELLKHYREKIDIVIKTTIVPSLIFRREDLEKIAETVNDLKATWILQPFNNTTQLIEKRYQGVNPPTNEFLQGIRENCLKLYPELVIEVEEKEDEHY